VTAPLRLCFVSSHGQLGGAELALETLLGHVPRESIAAIAVLGPGPLLPRLRASGLPATGIGLENRAQLLLAAYALRRLVRRSRPSVVHANGFRAAFVATLALLRLDIPLVWQKHDLAREGRITNWVARRAAVVVGVSRAAVETFAYDPRVQTVVVRNGVSNRDVDRARGRALVAEAVDVQAETRIVGLVGRLHPGKGQLELLEVMPDLRRGGNDTRVVFVGGADPTEPQYEQRVRERVDELELTSCVSFLGHRDDAAVLISGFDVLAVPSVRDPKSGWREGFGLAAVEALQAGTAVVGYASGALPETLGDCATLVREGDTAALAAALADTLTTADPERTERGRRLVREQFSIERAVATLSTVYVEAAAE
jgi:glycosyltransferase involved in cell wall biosynthesis